MGRLSEDKGLRERTKGTIKTGAKEGEERWACATTSDCNRKFQKGRNGI